MISIGNVMAYHNYVIDQGNLKFLNTIGNAMAGHAYVSSTKEIICMCRIS